MTYDKAYNAYLRARVDVGVALVLPDGTLPDESWGGDQKAQGQKVYSVWAEGKDNGTIRQHLGEHLDQEAAEMVKKQTEANPLASGLRVWIEEDNDGGHEGT